MCQVQVKRDLAAPISQSDFGERHIAVAPGVEIQQIEANRTDFFARWQHDFVPAASVAQSDDLLEILERRADSGAAFEVQLRHAVIPSPQHLVFVETGANPQLVGAHSAARHEANPILVIAPLKRLFRVTFAVAAPHPRGFRAAIDQVEEGIRVVFAPARQMLRRRDPPRVPLERSVAPAFAARRRRKTQNRHNAADFPQSFHNLSSAKLSAKQRRDGDIVEAARIVGRVHQRRAQPFRRIARRDDRLNLGVAKRIDHAVRHQNQAISRPQNPRKHVFFKTAQKPDVRGNHRAVGSSGIRFSIKGAC